MKVGDLVKPRPSFVYEDIDFGVGVVIDTHENDDGMEYFEVQWHHDRQWWKEYELELFSESR